MGAVIMGRSVFSVSLIVGMLVLAYGARGVEDPVKGNGGAGKHIGTWRLVSAKYNGVESDLPRSGVTLKHITPGNFVWLTYDSETKKITRAAGGTYTLTGDKYEEQPQYGLSGDFDTVRDNRHAFTMKIDGDTWHHDGALAGGLKIEEVWERVKEK
jgi:hypothetical protein